MPEKYSSTKPSQSLENSQLAFPFSHGQQALWHLYQLAPKSTALNIYCTVQMNSEVNLEVWHRAWQKIVQRHSILRTTYTTTHDSQPIQIVDPHKEIELEVIDASDWSEDDLRTQILAATDHPFDLENSSPLRVQLYTRQDKPAVQVLIMHHIAGDLWSFDILLEELQRFYATEMEVLTGNFAEENDVINQSESVYWQYSDYVTWQENTLDSVKREELWDYWKQELSGELPVLNLPTDRLRPPVQTYEGNSYFLKLDEALLGKLRELEKREEVNLETLLLAIFFVQLYRYTNQEDILIGSEMEGRSAHQEFKKIVGYFSDPVVLRANFSGNPTFKEFLAQVRSTVFKAIRHQDYPFPLLVEKLDANRDLSRSPLFQVAFTWQKHRWYETVQQVSLEEGKNLQMKPYSSGLQQGATLDLNLQIEEVGGSLVANWQYNTDLFDEATIARMAGHFQTLLEAIVANPEQRVSQLPLLTEAERNQLLVEWNDTQVDYPKDVCFHQLFEAQVKRTPDAVAVICENRELSYQELNCRANQLAHYLSSLEVGPEMIVGICVERSLEMVVGILGIIKSGAAYLPLDPSNPKERLSFMLEDAQVSLLLIQEHLLENLPEQKTQIVCLDSNGELFAQESQENLVIRATPKNLIAVFYTSGSTGQPKGTMINGIGFLNLCLWYKKYSKITEKSIALLLSPFSFDASFRNCMTALLAGGKTVLVDLFDPFEILKAIESNKITTINTTPSLFFTVLELASFDNYQPLQNLEFLALGGEQWSLISQLKSWLNSPFCHCELVNMYGPTECSDISIVYQIKREDVNTLKRVPIGKPIDNLRAYILDANNNLQPIGCFGELCLAGDGLARGYLNRPELTAEKFISNPWVPGEKIYKTGDLARWLPNGNLEFRGRIDYQVKLRGLRIEVEEIETILKQHPAVKEAAIIAREDTPDNKRLIAYVIPNYQPDPTSSELRHFLKEKLPDYMCPAVFVMLQTLPLSPNGKVDRRGLPTPNWSKQISEKTYIAPRNLIEKKLAEIWKKVLGLEQNIGIHDNFFELGGHSLRTVKLVAEIEKNFKQKLPVSALFKLGTIAELAPLLEQKTELTPTPATSQPLSSTPLSPEIYQKMLAFNAQRNRQRVSPNSLIIGLNTQGQNTPLFFCYGGYFLIDQLSHFLGKKQPIYALHSGRFVMEQTSEKIKKLATHYAQEILDIQPEGACIIGGYCHSTSLALEIAQQLITKGKTVLSLFLLEEFVPRSYPGNVALFLARESALNPYKSFQNPELGWRKFYNGGFSVNLVHGNHRTIWQEPNVHFFADQLRSAIKKAEAENKKAQVKVKEIGQLLPDSAYQAQISAQPLLPVSVGETLSISITIKNISPMVWKATESSGIRLGNHWLDESGKIIHFSDGRGDLIEDLLPDSEVELSLSVTAPQQVGRYVLELDLVEEGITWFKTKGSQTTTIEVQVNSESEQITLESDNSELEISCYKGNLAFQKGEINKAIINYQKFLQNHQCNSVEIYQNLGYSLSLQQRFSEAIIAYNEALKIQPDNDSICLRLAYAQLATKNLDGAIVSFLQAIELAPKKVWIYQKIAETLRLTKIFQRLGSLGKGIEPYFETYQNLHFDPKIHSEAYQKLGDFLQQIGQFEKAIKNYNQALKLTPDNSLIYYRLIYAYHQLGDVENAIANYQIVAQLNS